MDKYLGKWRGILYKEEEEDKHYDEDIGFLHTEYLYINSIMI